MKIPMNNVTCPITGELLVEPVIDHEGNTYEKEAILSWLQRSATSPITRNPLTPDQLFPNRALQELIDNDEISSVPTIVSSNDDTSSVPTTASSSPFGSDSNDQDADTTHLSEIAGKAVVDTAFSEFEGVGMIRVQVPDDDSERHLPANIICVIDESYSMNNAATTQEDQEGSSGLSLLDMVKHATKTVIASLGPNDKLAIVTYSDMAQIRLPLTKMTEANKGIATQAAEAFRPRGATNIWAGLLEAMNLASEEESATDIFLLTDGRPVIHPPRGELETFKRYKEKRSSWNYRVSTFGFGYQLDSKLLNDIAMEGDGQYFFIPDSSFVGTVFINATSFVLSTALAATEMEAGEAAQSFPIASLSFGQSFDVVIDGIFAKKMKNARTALTDVDIKTAILRRKLVALIRSAEGRFSGSGPDALRLAQEDVRNLIDEFNMALDCSGSDDSGLLSSLKAMREDLTGQITEAYSREDWHKKWGTHYLLSLARAHELQRCTNFKDPGLQVYATKKFSLIRDIAEDIFCTIPPPRPSLQRVNQATYQPVVSMSTYYNSAAGCLAKGDVLLADGRYVDVSLVAPGDMLQTRDGVVRVRCVVTTECDMGIENLVDLGGGVMLTPWHPVRVKGANGWSFPANLGQVKRYNCAVVYNFVLEDGVSVPIGPLEAIALGHGIVDDPVAKHDYFGSTKVVQDLSQMLGWNQGRVHLGLNPANRDPDTGLVTSFTQKNRSRDLTNSSGSEKIDSISYNNEVVCK